MTNILKPKTKKKINRQSGRQWGGCLQPSEIAVLFELGAQTLASYPSKQNIADMIESGNCRPIWFYFTPPPNSPLDEALHQR